MYDTILVPLDGSKRGESIIKHITELARKFNSKLILLTVVESKLLQGGEEMAAASMGNSTQSEEKVNKAKTYLAHLQDELVQKDIQVETRVVEGLPVAVIKETAKQVNADLIALASHGHGGLARVFYGSVATDILNHVDRPLFIIRSRTIKE